MIEGEKKEKQPSTVNAQVAEAFENTSFQNETRSKGSKVIKEPMEGSE